ncbi:MAG: SurA N-terminal domain-containing protein, partial [Candidatus Neomarinimicrobiota bacterium]
MMHILRERMHVILWLLLILFVGSMTVGGLVGGADIISQLFGRTDVSRAIAVVNGEIVSPDDFFRHVNARLEGFRNQEQEVNDRTLDQVRSAVWEEMVEMTLVDQEVKKRRIKVSNDEIYYHLLNNPPQLIQTIPEFQTDGQFNRDKYLDALRNPQGDEWTPIEMFVREYLPRQKLYDQIQEGVVLTDEQVRTEFIKRNVDYTISAIVIRSFGMDGEDTTPTNDEIENHYFLNPVEFQRDETRILSYLNWEKVPSEEDTTLVREEAVEILERLMTG